MTKMLNLTLQNRKSWMTKTIVAFKTPLELLSLPFSTSESVFPMVFGYVCFVHIHDPAQVKLDPCALKCVCVSYSPMQKGQKCYHPPLQKHFLQMDVAFFETQPYFSLAQPTLQGESLSEKEFSSSLPVPALVLEQEKQQPFTNGFPTDLTDKSYALPVWKS